MKGKPKMCQPVEDNRKRENILFWPYNQRREHLVDRRLFSSVSQARSYLPIKMATEHEWNKNHTFLLLSQNEIGAQVLTDWVLFYTHLYLSENVTEQEKKK